jgi:pSer/pThr/pTyr-binding forkhead associated (FHA) protein
MWKLRIEDDQSNRTVVSLVRKRYTIGRAEPNAVRLTERNVSRNHAVLERRGDVWVFRDLDSYNGSFVDDERVEGELEVGHGARIRIGDYMVVLYDDAIGDIASSQSAMTMPAGHSERPTAVPGDRFVMIDGPNVGTEYPLDERRILIGRGEECDISLNDTSVSRVHADVELDESGRYRIGDQASSNGLRVNGMEVQTTTLYSGDIVELGDVQLQFVPKGQVFTPSDHPRAPSPTPGFWTQLGKGPRIGIIAGGVAVAGALLLYGGGDPPEPHVESPGASDATVALAEAKQHFEDGRLDAAHETLSRINPKSNLRKSRTFQSIELEWARAMLKAAARSDDVDAKRRLLDEVARTQTVPEEQRRQALDRLAALSKTDVDVAALPQADAGLAEDEAYDDEMPDEAAADHDSAGSEDEVANASPPPRKATKPARPPAPKPRPKPAAPKPAPKPSEPTPTETAPPPTAIPSPPTTGEPTASAPPVVSTHVSEAPAAPPSVSAPVDPTPNTTGSTPTPPAPTPPAPTAEDSAP